MTVKVAEGPGSQWESPGEGMVGTGYRVKSGIVIHAIIIYNTYGTLFMTRQRMRKVTYSLPEDLLEGVRSVVREGAAPSYSAFVQRALADGVNRAREALLAEAFLSASQDPEFLEDVDRSLQAFGNSRDDGARDR
jgi:Arc/MetJ-type ribon-helix-helix transcriptional regulator